MKDWSLPPKNMRPPPQMHVPRMGWADHSRGRGPIPAVKHTHERMLVRQRRTCRLKTQQTAQLAAVRQSPVGVSEGRPGIHRLDELKTLLPGERELGEVSIPRPGQTGESVQYQVSGTLNTRMRPGNAPAELRVLTTSCARNLCTVSAVTGDLSGLEVSLVSRLRRRVCARPSLRKSTEQLLPQACEGARSGSK